MYETLMMLRPGEEYSQDEMEALIREIATAGPGEFVLEANSMQI